MNLQTKWDVDVGLEVDHRHLHLTPRYTGDEVELSYDRKELGNGEKIREEISSCI